MNKQEQNTKIVTDAMDLIAGFKLLTNQEKTEVLQNIINALGSYSKPRQKGDPKEPKNNVLGAYLCISNVRNACKLCLLNIWSYQTAKQVINYNLEGALSELMQDIKIQFPEKAIVKGVN